MDCGRGEMQKRFVALMLLCCSCLVLPAMALAEDITARYSQPRGTNITWSITIPDPPPAAVIVIQTIPPGTEIISASPAYSSYDKRTGTAKWLLSGVHPGRVVMQMKLSQPIRKKGEIHGKIIFQDQGARATASTSMVLTPKTKKKAIEGC
ncbi:MAG: hypothetical protein PF495_04895 [Spirochaetales bacterium]|jgi:hypothetical protein|nr:hypothetical protein [Spirochaetales bacterium]